MRSRPLAWGLGGLWLLAIVLALIGLSEVPLRDWDEGIVARVALETSTKPWPELLLPTLWGDPYLNKPPGLHLLIGGAIRIWRSIGGSAPETLPPEGLLRAVPALVSSTVVPLMGLVQWRLRPRQPAVALASAAIALTLLPLARHGRLVMLDGSQLVAILTLWWAVLTPDHRQGSLLLHGGLAGLAVSAMLLLKAPLAFPVLAGTLVLRALDQDLQRRHWLWLLCGLAWGLLPGLGWHGFHLLQRGPDALAMWGSQGFARLHRSIEGHGGGPPMPILKVLEGGWPWLALWPGAMALAWRGRHTRAGRWTLGTTAITAALVLPLRTQLPWYSHLLWPPLVLACAPVLVWLVDRPPALQPPWPGVMRRVPLFWALLGICLVVLALIVTLKGSPAIRTLGPLAALGGCALLVGGGLLLAPWKRRRQAGAMVLVGGLWATLVVLMGSPLWLWELNEAWSVPPVAQLVRQQANASASLWGLEERPSLNWYAGKRLKPWTESGPMPQILITLEGRPPLLSGWMCSELPTPSPAAPSPAEVHVFRCRAVNPPGNPKKT